MSVMTPTVVERERGWKRESEEGREGDVALYCIFSPEFKKTENKKIDRLPDLPSPDSKPFADSPHKYFSQKFN